MPHYKDGKLAQLGDHVYGTGYNVKRPICGIVTEIRPGEDKAGGCTLSVTFIELSSPESIYTKHQIGNGQCVEFRIEYGDTVGFDLVSRKE